MKTRALGLSTTTLLVVASMVGTGVFTTSGFLVRDLGSISGVLISWLVGGVAALCGALTYAELFAMFPENGGEYRLLGKVFHPIVGFMAGWTSLVVGFSAPIAASAIAFGEYGTRVIGVSSSSAVTGLGVAVIVVASLVHLGSVRAGGRFQNLFTFTKILLVIGFVVGGTFMLPDNLGKSTMKPKSLLSGNFAAGLVYVSFAYTGWNAATYVAGEVKKPHRTVPLSLIVGTLLVTFLYMGLNAVFLLSVPLDELSGVTEVGHVAAAALFGESAARVMSAIIALGLISTVGALVMTGPRVYEAVGEDFHVLRKLAVRKSPAHGPTSAIYGQGCIAVLLVLSTSFDALLTYIGFTLSVFAALTAAAVIVLRVRSPDLPRPYRVWLYPLPPIIFISLNLWMIYHVVSLQPVITLAGVGTVLVGGVFFVLMRRRGPANPTQTASGSVPIPLTRPQKGDASSDELP